MNPYAVFRLCLICPFDPGHALLEVRYALVEPVRHLSHPGQVPNDHDFVGIANCHICWHGISGRSTLTYHGFGLFEDVE
ncbi:hypothetical protein EDB80DRAFT_83864 [Ilyonectria destructans]|nr:hypothetical protein EDB80DRAFT_83864 [Ilyonectria destructans]